MLNKPFQNLSKLLKPLIKQSCGRISIIGRFEHTDECQTLQPISTCECPCESKPKQDDTQCPKTHVQLFDINCKTAVIIGGTHGIGFSTAYEILDQKAKVVGILGNNVCRGMEACESLCGSFGHRKAVFYKADVNCSSELECALCNLTYEFGRIDIFINSFATCDGKNWEKELTTNLVGMARCTVLAHQYLADGQKGGVIVNLAGIFGFVPLAGCPTTSAAQHGIIGLSRSFGKELLFNATKVRVITLCPGVTETHLFRDADKKALNPFMGKCLKEEMQKMKKQTPDVCGKTIVWLLRFAESGSVWLIEGGGMYKVECDVPHSCAQLYYQFPA